MEMMNRFKFNLFATQREEHRSESQFFFISQWKSQNRDFDTQPGKSIFLSPCYISIMKSSLLNEMADSSV